MNEPKRIWWARPRKLCALERPGGGGRSHRPERREAEIAWLKEHGVRTVISTMSTRHNLPAYEAAGLGHHEGGRIDVGRSPDRASDRFERHLLAIPSLSRSRLNSSTVVLRTEGLTKSFGGIHAVQDVSLEVAPGEVGTIYVRNSSQFDGYTSGDTKTFREGYMSSGDVGRLDELGSGLTAYGIPWYRSDGNGRITFSTPGTSGRTSGTAPAAGSGPGKRGPAHSARSRIQAAWAARVAASSPLAVSRSSAYCRTVSSRR